jgi:phage tail-like protein
MGSTNALSSAVGELYGQVGLTHRFTVVLDDDLFELGEWQKVSGLSVTWDPCTYRTGDMGNDILLYPGATRYDNVRLTRAACGASQDVQDWLGRVSRKWSPMTGAIALTDWLGTKIIEWPLRELIPVGWSITEFDAGNGQIAAETLQIAHTGFLDDTVSSSRSRSRRTHW